MAFLAGKHLSTRGQSDDGERGYLNFHGILTCAARGITLFNLCFWDICVLRPHIKFSVIFQDLDATKYTTCPIFPLLLFAVFCDILERVVVGSKNKIASRLIALTVSTAAIMLLTKVGIDVFLLGDYPSIPCFIMNEAVILCCFILTFVAGCSSGFSEYLFCCSQWQYPPARFYRLDKAAMLPAAVLVVSSAVANSRLLSGKMPRIDEVITYLIFALIIILAYILPKITHMDNDFVSFH